MKEDNWPEIKVSKNHIYNHSRTKRSLFQSLLIIHNFTWIRTDTIASFAFKNKRTNNLFSK